MNHICKTLGMPLVGLSFLFAIASCAAPQRQEFNIKMRTVSDDGQLLPGVQVFHGEQDLGTTRESGVLEVSVDASSGSTFDVHFACPKGYQSTRDKVTVPLRNAALVAQDKDSHGAANAMALTLECRPDKRKATVVVKANMANLPLRMGNKVVGKTNADGVAYVSLNFRAKEVFELSLDTSSESMLHPANPHFPFVMPARDEVFVIQEAFQIVEPPPPPPRVKKKVKRVRKKPVKVPEKKPEIKRPTRRNGVS